MMKNILYTCVAVALMVFLSACSPNESNGQKTEADQIAQTQDLVNRAAELLTQEGEASFATLMDREAGWLTDENYLFVTSLKGKTLMHATLPDLVGKNNKNLEDANGKLINQEFVRVAQSPEGEGWVEYVWPPEEGMEPILKKTFVKSVMIARPGKKPIAGFVASGYYPVE